MRFPLAPRTLLGAFLIAALATQASAEVRALVQPGYGPQPVPCYPASHWVPSHRTVIQEEVWVPATSKQVWVAPVFEQRCGLFGVIYTVQVQPGHYVTQVQPAHMQLVSRTVIVPGHWETSPALPAKPHFAKPHGGYGGYGGALFGKHGKQKHKGYGG